MSELIGKLLDNTSSEWSTTWSTFLFNVLAVQALGYPPQAQDIITAGEAWRGDGWTTSRASKVLYEVTGVPLVSATVEDYKGAFLYALALHWGLDVASFELSERASDAAFALASAFSWVDQEEGVREDEMEDDDDDTEGGEPVFPWEERLQMLPHELQVLWKRYGMSSSVRFDTKWSASTDFPPRRRRTTCSRSSSKEELWAGSTA